MSDKFNLAYESVTELKELSTANDVLYTFVSTQAGVFKLNPNLLVDGATRGDTGKSAYELALTNGYVGSVTAWLTSLEGVDGNDGGIGITGPAGPTGDRGPTGLTGNTGFGVIGGGTTGQVLTKSSDVSYEVEWTTVSGGGGAVAWGDITGVLSSQTDLQSALDGKAGSLGVDDNYVTDAEKIVIGNTSGTNTGDQDLSSYITGYTETDTLDDVTGRGSTTTNAITASSFTATGTDIVLTSSGFATTLRATGSGARLINFPNNNGTVCLVGNVATISSKTITSAQNSLSVAVADLEITGTPNGTQFLRDDGAWATPAGGGASLTTAPAVFQATGSTNITSTVATVAFNTEVFDPDTNYALSSNEITCTLSGYYQVSVNIPVSDDGYTGGSRSSVFTYLEQDQASGTWITVENCRAQDYARELSGGEGVNFSGIVLLQANEVIRVRIEQTATTDLSTESAQASLNIHRVRAV